MPIVPIDYQINPDLGVVRHEFAGEISYTDLARHWRKFLTDPALPDPLFMIADMRDCRVLVHGDDAHRLVQEVIEPLLGDRRWISSVVAASSAEYGATRQFIAYSHRCGETEVFRNLDEAVDWLTARRRDGMHGASPGHTCLQ